MDGSRRFDLHSDPPMLYGHFEESKSRIRDDSPHSDSLLLLLNPLSPSIESNSPEEIPSPHELSSPLLSSCM